jgi:hypothetical protein
MLQEHGLQQRQKQRSIVFVKQIIVQSDDAIQRSLPIDPVAGLASWKNRSTIRCASWSLMSIAWRLVDELIAGETVKTYDKAVGILKDLRAVALHKQRMEEFLRRIEGIRGKYSRLTGLQWRIENAKLLERLEKK